MRNFPITSLSSTSKLLQANPIVRWGAISIWIIVTVLHLALFFVVLAVDYSQMLIPCEGTASIEGVCNVLAVSSLEVDVLSSWGLGLQHYAIIMIIAPIITLLAYLPLGFLILWRQGASQLGLTVSLTMIVIPVYMYIGNVAWEVIDPKLFLPGQIISIIGPTILILFLYLVPNGRFSPSWAYIPLIIFLLLAILAVADSIVSFSETIAFFIGITAFAMIVLGIAFQIHRYFRDSTPLERQQMKWILFAIVFFFAAFILWILVFDVLAIPSGPPRLFANVLGFFISEFLLTILPISIGMAILRYGLWNIDIAINRSLVGVVVTGILLIIFVPSVFLIQGVLGAENTVVSFFVSAAIPALIFNPTRKRVRQFIDRRVYGLAFNLDELGQAQKARNILNPGALTGQKLGDYDVQGLIGKGGMGEVYQGYGDGQSVAIKTMLPEVAKDTDMRTRFEREADAGKRLDHPNIARVYDNGSVGDTPYIIMEYVEGQDLGEILKAESRFDEESARTIIQQVCSALDTAHAQGYVHRDIKPSNIMLRDKNSQAVLMDFGITKAVDATSALTGTGAIGTIDYMAPEQIMSAKEVDHRADIYALGIVAYELLTGEKPFKGSAAQVMFAHIQQPPPYARDINPDTPEHMADAIEKAMSKDPDNRYASAGAFAEAMMFL